MPLHFLNWRTFRVLPECSSCKETLTGFFRQGLQCCVCMRCYHSICVQHEMRCPEQEGVIPSMGVPKGVLADLTSAQRSILDYRLTNTKPVDEEVALEEGYEHGWIEFLKNESDTVSSEEDATSKCAYCGRMLSRGVGDSTCLSCHYCKALCCIECWDDNKDNLSCVSDDGESPDVDLETMGISVSYEDVPLNADILVHDHFKADDLGKAASDVGAQSATVPVRYNTMNVGGGERRSMSMCRYNSMSFNMSSVRDELAASTHTGTGYLNDPSITFLTNPAPSINTVTARSRNGSIINEVKRTSLPAPRENVKISSATRPRGNSQSNLPRRQVNQDLELHNSAPTSRTTSTITATNKIRTSNNVSAAEKTAMKTLGVSSSDLEKAHFFHHGPPPGLTQQQRRDIFEIKLKGRSDGTWLIRKSRGEYILTIIYSRRIWHVIIKQEGDKFFVHTGDIFDSIMELLAYYTNTQLSETLPTRMVQCIDAREMSIYDCID
eukprot:CFRG4836T1